MASAGPGTLTTELAAYERLLPTLMAHENKFALIAGEELLGIFDTYPDALNEGYRLRGLAPFLVKRVAATEMVAYFSRDLCVN